MSQSVNTDRGKGQQYANFHGHKPTVEAMLEKLQFDSFCNFLNETNPVNGLVIGKSAADWPASIAATGLALTC